MHLSTTLPREVVDVSSLDMFKVRLDGALINLAVKGVLDHGRGFRTRLLSKVPSAQTIL